MGFWHTIHDAGMGMATTSEQWDGKEMGTGIQESRQSHQCFLHQRRRFLLA